MLEWIALGGALIAGYNYFFGDDSSKNNSNNSASSSSSDFPYLSRSVFDPRAQTIRTLYALEDCGNIQVNSSNGSQCRFTVPGLNGRNDPGVYFWVADGWDLNSQSAWLPYTFKTWREKSSKNKIDNLLLYLGSAEKIGRRFQQYGNPGESQSTNIKMNEAAARLTAKGKRIRIYFSETCDYHQALEDESWLLGNILTFFNYKNNLW